MAEEPENLTIRLLQELRAEMSEMRASMNERFDEVTLRLDGNTVLLTMLAGLVHRHEERLTKLEHV